MPLLKVYLSRENNTKETVLMELHPSINPLKQSIPPYYPIITGLVKKLAGHQEVTQDKEARKFFKLFCTFEYISSTLIDEFIVQIPWAQTLKRTYGLVRLIKDHQNGTFIQQLAKVKNEEIVFRTVAKHAAREKETRLLSSLLEKASDNSILEREVIEACDNQFLQEIFTQDDILFLELLMSCLHLGMHEKLLELLQISVSFPWHDIDISMGHIFERLCKENYLNAVQVLRLLKQFGYDPCSNCRTTMSLVDYAKTSNCRPLQKLVIEEVLFDRPDLLASLLYELFKDKEDLLTLLELNLNDLKGISRSLQSATLALEQFRVLFPLILLEEYPLNSSRPDISLEYFSGLKKKYNEMLNLAYSSIPEKYENTSTEALDTIKFISEKIEDGTFSYLKGLLQAATEKLAKNSSCISGHTSKMWNYSCIFQNLLLGRWDAYKNNKTDNALTRMHHIMSFGTAQELKSHLSLFHPDVNTFPATIPEHRAFSLVRERQKDKLVVWLNNGGDPNLKNAAGETLLGIACYRMFSEIVQVLLTKKAMIEPLFTSALEEVGTETFSLVDWFLQEHIPLKTKDKFNTLKVLVSAVFSKYGRQLRRSTLDERKKFFVALRKGLFQAMLKFLGLEYGGLILKDLLGGFRFAKTVYGKHSYSLRQYIYQQSKESIYAWLKLFKYAAIEKKLLDEDYSIETMLNQPEYIEYLYYYSFRDPKNTLNTNTSLILQKIETDANITKVNFKKFLVVISKLFSNENGNNIDFEETWEKFPSHQTFLEAYTKKVNSTEPCKDLDTTIIEYSSMHDFITMYTWMKHVIDLAQSANLQLGFFDKLENLKLGYQEVIKTCQAHQKFLEGPRELTKNLVNSLSEKGEGKRLIYRLSSTSLGQTVLINLLANIFAVNDEKLIDRYREIALFILKKDPTLIKNPLFQENKAITAYFLSRSDYSLLHFALQNGYNPSVDAIIANLIHVTNYTAFEILVHRIISGNDDDAKIKLLNGMVWDEYEVEYKLIYTVIKEVISFNADVLNKAFAEIIVYNSSNFSTEKLAKLLSFALSDPVSTFSAQYALALERK